LETLSLVSMESELKVVLTDIHHTSVEPIGRVGQDENDNVDVKSAQIGPLPPCQAFKSTTGEEEMALWRLDRHDLLGGLGWAKREAHDGWLVPTNAEMECNSGPARWRRWM
jgi:hypothetical protein